MPQRPARVALAILSFSLAVCASYALQRLWDARAEPPMGTVLLQATIPYYWRCAVALLHGLGIGTTVLLAVPEAAAARWLDRAPVFVVLVVVPAAVALLAVP